MMIVPFYHSKNFSNKKDFPAKISPGSLKNIGCVGKLQRGAGDIPLFGETQISLTHIKVGKAKKEEIYACQKHLCHLSALRFQKLAVIIAPAFSFVKSFLYGFNTLMLCCVLRTKAPAGG